MTQRISEFLYVVLLRHLDYAEDFDIAELEIELEAEGKLDEFIKTCKKLHNQDWKMIRKGAQRISRASAVLHEIDPKTYPTADSWTQSQRNRDTSITLTKVVERCFELVGRRRPGKALVWVIDEVGQHVARSDDKIEDLRAVVQEFGLVGRNLVKAKEAHRPGLDDRHLAGKAGRSRLGPGLEAGATGEAARPLPAPGRSGTVRHPRGRHEACLGEEGKGRADPEEAILGEPGATERRHSAWSERPARRRSPRPISSSSIPTRRTTSTSASASSPVCGSSRGHPSSTAAATARSSSKPTRCSCPNART